MIHRFFLNPEDTEISIKNEETVHQIGKVLRLQPNEQIILLDGTPNEILASIVVVSKKEIIVKVISRAINTKEPLTSLHLFFAPLKNPDKTEFILQKCTEIGVKSFTPIITERTERKFLPKRERLERIIKEAAEQSGRWSLPTLNEITDFSKCLDLDGINLIGNLNSKNHISSFKENTRTINLFIGPEGGFSLNEIDTALSNGFKDFQMGKLTLRAETACIVASGILVV